MNCRDYGEGILARLHTGWLSTQSQSYPMTNSQSTSMSWHQATIWDPRPILLSLPWKLYLVHWGLVIMGHILWLGDWSVIYGCCWASPAQSFLGLSPVGLVTIFYFLNFETPPIWRARFPYLFPPGRGWPSYTHGHWVPFLLPLTTHRATVQMQQVAIWSCSVHCELHVLEHILPTT
jgi:hypothetical protein